MTLQLTPPPGESVRAHFEGLADRFPLGHFEARVVEFLQHMLESFPRPWIVQLEDGKLDFLSEEETTALKAHLNWYVLYFPHFPYSTQARMEMANEGAATLIGTIKR
jgi:hypothetical protein